MSKTLLNGVNEILRRTGNVAGDQGLLTSLTDSARQASIDQAVQVINEGIDELFTTTNVPLPNEQSSSTVVLVTATRFYTLATDLAELHWPLRDTTNLQFIHEFSGGYNAILDWDRGQNFTGLPHFGAIRPTDGKLFLDRSPTSAENGRTYTYQYDKDTALSLAADTMPFGDPVFRAMVPAWVQLFKRERRDQFDEPLFKMSIGRAARRATKSQSRDSYSPRV